MLESQAGHITTEVLLVMVAGIFGFFVSDWLTKELVGGLIAGVLASVLTYFFSRANHWRMYRKPWYTEYEPQRGDVHKRIDIYHATEPQHIQLTHRFTARVHVERIRFTFTDGSQPPKITRLYDWNTSEGYGDTPLNPNVRVRPNDRGAMYWEYHNPLLRTSGPRGLQNTAAVCLVIETDGVFDGFLDVQLTFEERSRMPKPERIPFHVATKR